MSKLKSYIKDVIIPRGLTLEDIEHHGIKNIVLYDDLGKFSSINQLLGKTKEVIILYQLESKTNGHWVSLFKNSLGLHYFDPYGKKPDHWLYQGMTYNDSDPLLSMLIEKYQTINPHETVYYNEFAIQKSKEDIATCGRWNILRLKHKELTDKQFFDCFGKKVTLSPDELIAIII